MKSSSLFPRGAKSIRFLLWRLICVFALFSCIAARAEDANVGFSMAHHGNGCYVVTASGTVHVLGDASSSGSLRSKPPSPIVGIAARPQDDGYWIAAADGQVYGFGNAQVLGSMSGFSLNQPVVGIAATADGSGYWLVARDGGVFSFNAPFRGSRGSLSRGSNNNNIVGIASSANGGYWLLSEDGDVFAFGAPFNGSMAGKGFTDFVAISATSDGRGYWLLRKSGAAYRFDTDEHNGGDATLEFAARFLQTSVFLNQPLTNNVAQYHIRLWQIVDGLPQNTVQSVTQTRDGYLWIGTQDGLARFDGVHFTRYQPKDFPSSNVRNINKICEAADGSLWIGGAGFLVARKDGKFIDHTRDANVATNTVLAMFQDRHGVLWIGTRVGLTRIENGKFIHYAPTNVLSQITVRGICEDVDGSLWLASSTGLYHLEGEKVTTLNEFNGLQNNLIRSVYVDRHGYLWAGSNGGLSRIYKGKITNYSRNDGLSDNTVNTVTEDSKGNLWIGTYSGLNRWVNGKFVPEFNAEGEPFDVIFNIFEDGEGNIWIGAKDGLFRLRYKRFNSFTIKQGLGGNNAMSVREDSEGNLWIATWGGGVNKLRDGRISVYSTANTPGMASDLVLSLCQARDRSLWWGCDFNLGVYRFQNGNLKHYGRDDGLTDETAVRVIFEDSRSNLWVGTTAQLYVLKDTHFAQFEAPQGFTPGTVRCITEDHEGTIWIGGNRGLMACKGETCRLFTVSDGLPENNVNCICEDREKNLWIATSAGLSRLKAGRLTTITAKDGLVSDTIFDIVEDDYGYLWMTSLTGVSRVSKANLSDFADGKRKEVNPTRFGKEDGMVSAQCNGVAKPGAWKTRDGRLWFATTKGVAVVDSAFKTATVGSPPSVFLDEVVADKRRVFGDNTDGRSGTAESDSIAIMPGRGDLEFHYTALSFAGPENSRFKYKLQGVDPDWVDAETRRVAYYSHVPPGRYQFRVIACDGEGVWNNTGVSVGIILQPHVWQSWLFKFAVGVLVIVSAATIYSFRTVRSRHIEKLRMRIAADLHDEIGSSIGSISLLARKIHKTAPLSDEQTKDLGSIHRIAGQTANSIRDIVWFINPEYDTVQDLVLRMKDVAGTMLSTIPFQFIGPKENLNKKLPLDFRREIFLIFKESLANITKHSQATSVCIHFSEEDDVWQLRIADDGIGFDAAVSYSGNGLKNLRRRAEKIAGTLTITSQPDAGTELVFRKRKL